MFHMKRRCSLCFYGLKTPSGNQQEASLFYALPTSIWCTSRCQSAPNKKQYLRDQPPAKIRPEFIEKHKEIWRREVASVQPKKEQL